ncbi:hypothetical protein JCM15831A_27010 [Asaia astilbis]
MCYLIVPCGVHRVWLGESALTALALRSEAKWKLYACASELMLSPDAEDGDSSMASSKGSTQRI